MAFTTGTKHILCKKKKQTRQGFPGFSDLLRLDDPDPGASIIHCCVSRVEQYSMIFKQTEHNYFILEIFKRFLKFSIIVEIA